MERPSSSGRKKRRPALGLNGRRRAAFVAGLALRRGAAVVAFFCEKAREQHSEAAEQSEEGPRRTSIPHPRVERESVDENYRTDDERGRFRRFVGCIRAKLKEKSEPADDETVSKETLDAISYRSPRFRIHRCLPHTGRGGVVFWGLKGILTHRGWQMISHRANTDGASAAGATAKLVATHPRTSEDGD